jgi:hypothetical protein
MNFAPRRIAYKPPMPLLKKLIWTYFLLLIFEGALRKWILTPLAAPLLLVRDPVAILIIWEAYRQDRWPQKWSTLMGILTACLMAICVAQVVLVNNLWIAAIYGLRSYLLPFPVAFIMGEYLNEEDLRKFGVCTLWLLLLVTGIEIAQYMAPQGSFLNRGASEGGGQIIYVGERVRASGTFSFVTGPASFTPLAAAFVLYGFVRERFAKKQLLWAAAFALLLSVPIIGSRTIVFELAGVVACAAIAAFSGVSQLFKSLRLALPLLAISFLVSLLPIFSQASTHLRQRFTEASSSEGSASNSLEKRTFGSLSGTIGETDFLSNPIGVGMGAGAAAISKLTTGDVYFITGESEFSRLLNELGAFPGLFFMTFRLLLGVMVFSMAIGRARSNEPLALLLFPVTFSTLFMGVLEQPTEQGFMVVALGFSLCALRTGVVPISVLPRGIRIIRRARPVQLS